MRDDATATELTLLQVTDPHLFEALDGALLGIDTAASLRSVLGAARDAGPAPALILATGDISQDGAEGGYQRFIDLVREHFDAPLYWLPGNHDLAAPMVHAADAAAVAATGVGSAGADERVLDLPVGWRLVLLDTHIEHQVPGRLGPEQLELLDQALSEASGRPVLVALHHHVHPVGAAWIDSQRIAEAEAFHARVAAHDAPLAVLCGHVHQSLDEVIDGVRYLASPATCFQFLPRCDDFGLDRKGPGCRWLTLYADGRLETRVQRVALTQVPDLTATGY